MFRFFRKKSDPPEVPEPPDPSWCKVDESWFNHDFYWARPHETVHGPVAHFYEDGQLKSLLYYSRGKESPAHNRLELEQGRPVASVHSYGIHCSFDHGFEEILFCLDQDPERLTGRAQWEEWVRKWIEQICAGARVTRLVERGPG